MRLVAAALLLIAGSAQAKEQHCMTRVLMDVPAEEAPEQMKSKSSGDFGPVVQIKVNKRTGKMLYCAHESYCYNSNAFEMTTPCRIKRDDSMSNGSYYSFFTR